MKLAIVRRPLDLILKKEPLELGGPIIWSTFEYDRREAIYLIERDDGVEIPEVDPWAT